MLFNSFSFLIFFPVVICLYYLLPQKARGLWILLASCYFYMTFVPKYILILFFLITLDYFWGREIESRTGKSRKLLLIASLVANLGTLFFFKYFNFFNENIASLANLIGWHYSPFLLQIILPLGLSFHVFQSLSYVIEVYRGKYPAEKNYLTYALYVMFFPQLVAGPIERPQELLPQLKIPHGFDSDNIRSGLERMVWGFFKKVVIADNLAAYADQVYLNPHGYSGSILLVATVFFAFQIYCDFSGYSDIAVGAAQVMGIRMINNFNYPFFATSMADFWRRWHISLSNWLRDYLYTPLVLAARGAARLRIYFSLFVTFVLIGLWHGANWTFVAFGALHGFYMVFAQATKRGRERLVAALKITRWPRLYRVWQSFSVFGLACVGFIFFRADNVREAFFIIERAGVGFWELLHSFFYSGSFLGFINSLLLDGQGRRQFVFLCGLTILIVAFDIVGYRNRLLPKIQQNYSWLRVALIFSAVLAIMNLGVTHEIPFIYFAF